MPERRELVAFIPARGGSKRLPGKNIRRLGGVPVLGRVIDAIREARIAKAVCVSTDDRAVAAVARRHGALVLEPRGRALSGDKADFKDLLRGDVPRHLAALNVEPERADVLFVLATAALVKPEHYRQAHRRFLNERPDVLAATSAFETSPYRALVEGPSGAWRPLFPARLTARSQDLPAARRDAGLFYFLNFRAASRLKRHWFLARRLACHPVPRSVSVDVDTAEDWELLEERWAALHHAPKR